MKKFLSVVLALAMLLSLASVAMADYSGDLKSWVAEATVEFTQKMVDQFKAYIKENYPQYGDIEVVYDTSDTNETLYSELQTGKSNYDVINVSEYMAQKIVSGNYAVPLYRHNGASLKETPKGNPVKRRLTCIIWTRT